MSHALYAITRLQTIRTFLLYSKMVESLSGTSVAQLFIHRPKLFFSSCFRCLFRIDGKFYCYSLSSIGSFSSHPLFSVGWFKPLNWWLEGFKVIRNEILFRFFLVEFLKKNHTSVPEVGKSQSLGFQIYAFQANCISSPLSLMKALQTLLLSSTKQERKWLEIFLIFLPI